MPVYTNPIIIHCRVNGVNVPFEVDSGAAVSTICSSYLHSIHATVSPTSKIVRGYSGCQIQVTGECDLEVNYQGNAVSHSFLVVENSTVNLFGRDLFGKFNFHIVHKPNDIPLNQLSSNLRHEFASFFDSSFTSNVKELTKLDVREDVQPVYCKARKVPLRLRSKLKIELDRLVEAGIITKVHTSQWATPVVTVFKSSGDIRLCADFSVTLNKHITPVNSVLPTVDDVISTVGQATVFSKIDLSQAFLQLPIHPDSRHLLVINTPEGLFRYNYLPFGLSASPGIFQSFMCRVLDNIPGVIVYQDDLLVLSSDVNSHTETLHKVLTKLREVGLKLNVNKCSFFTDKVNYLGFIFDATGVRPNPTKLRAILDAPVPSNVKQVQSYLGLCNFYSRFIPNFAHCMSPLYALLKKDAKFAWAQCHQTAFDKIKNFFTQDNVLQHFNPKYESSIETDSSSYGLGAVLLQRPRENAPWMPVQFASRSLNDAEKNYSQIEREALSVIFGVNKFREFLLGAHFVIFNDHKPLFTLFAKNRSVPHSCSARVQRWALKLSQFNYDFVYSKGTLNVHSDFLSRLPLPESVEHTEPYELICAVTSLSETLISHEEVQSHTDRDPDLSLLKTFIIQGCPNRIRNPMLLRMKSNIPDMTIMKGCIMYRNRVFIPASLRDRVLSSFHQDHPGIVGMKSIARSLIWYPGLDRDIENLVKSCHVCQLVRNCPPQNAHVPWPVPSKPWQRVHIDHFFYEDKICLLAIDAYSKYIEVEVVKNVSVQETIDTLRLVFSRHGLPDVICSDNATCFTAAEFACFLKNNGVEHVTSPPYSPASNGQAERGVRVVKDLLNKQKKTESFRNRLCRVLFYYRCAPHNVTQTAPSIALNGRKLVTAKDRINPMFSNIKERPNVNTKMRQFETGDNVLALNVRGKPKWLRGKVVRRLGVTVYLVHVPELDITWKRHCNQLLAIPNDNNTQSHSENLSDSVPAVLQ